MSNTREFTVPIFHAILTLLGTAEGLIKFEPNDKERFETFIQKWVEAEQFRETDPRQFLLLFGEGLAIFITLPDYVRDAQDRASGKYLLKGPIDHALLVAGSVAYTARIRVTFTEEGSVFS